MKTKTTKKKASSLTTVLTHSLPSAGLRILNREAPQQYKDFLFNCCEIKNKKPKIITLIDCLNEIFAYCLVNNDSVDKSGEVTLICVGDNLHFISFIAHSISIYLNIEGCGGTIRVIIANNKTIGKLNPKDYIDRCDFSFVSSREPYCDGVYKGIIIPKHSKIWIIKTCENYWNENQLHHRLIDMRSYKNLISQLPLNSDNAEMLFIRSETIDPFINSRSFLHDHNSKNRWSTDYLCGDRYGYNKIYFVLPMTKADFENKNLINGLKILFKNDLDRDLFKSRFGFYIMYSENETLDNEPYDKSYDVDVNYTVVDYTNELLNIIYS